MYLHQFDNFLFLFENYFNFLWNFVELTLFWTKINDFWTKCHYFWSKSINFDRISLFLSTKCTILSLFWTIFMKNQQFFTIFRENDRNLAKFLYFLNDFFEILMIYRHICAFSRLLMSLRNQQFYRNMSLFETISLDFRQF